MTRLFGRASSQMCTRKADGKIIEETPSRQVKELFKAAGIKILSPLGFEDVEAEYLLKPKVEKEE